MEQNKTIKIFLGSSVTELHDERVDLGNYLMNSVRPIIKEGGIEIEVCKCEGNRSGNTGKHPQKEIDKLLRGCDVSVFMFKSKAGDMSVHEFEVARKLQKRKRHTIFVYCFRVQEADKSKELKDFQDRLEKESFYWDNCTDVKDLESQFVLFLMRLFIQEQQLQKQKQTKDFIAQAPNTISESQLKDFITQAPITTYDLRSSGSMTGIASHIPHFGMNSSERAQKQWGEVYLRLVNQGWLWRNEVDYHGWVYVCCGQQKAPDGPVVWHGSTAALAYIVRTKFNGQWKLARLIFCLPENRSLPVSFNASHNPSHSVTNAIDRAFSFQQRS